MPGLFRRWAPVAWGDLLAEMPDEARADLPAEAPAREMFARLVREALCTQVVLGTVIRGRREDAEVTQTERRSIISWCERLAQPGRWLDLRSYRVWCRRQVLEDGEARLCIAIRHELFAQVGADRRLRELGPTAFKTLAAKYGVGQPDRPCGERAIVLSEDLIFDLITDPDEENVDGKR